MGRTFWEGVREEEVWKENRRGSFVSGSWVGKGGSMFMFMCIVFIYLYNNRYWQLDTSLVLILPLVYHKFCYQNLQ